ncbi:hypothetical protein [Prosthecobacter sp.]|uniref:hypothetical protein n=1 Tax=Prosthecobacter sp. TaxID=1965333 RepID=UPI002487178D|nr:hypothetical protein [Prosthecobacter sp.]MDI1313281.1 hypothetical protein [Prosthecobacter sp.]
MPSYLQLSKLLHPSAEEDKLPQNQRTAGASQPPTQQQPLGIPYRPPEQPAGSRYLTPMLPPAQRQKAVTPPPPFAAKPPTPQPPAPQPPAQTEQPPPAAVKPAVSPPQGGPGAQTQTPAPVTNTPLPSPAAAQPPATPAPAPTPSNSQLPQAAAQVAAPSPAANPGQQPQQQPAPAAPAPAPANPPAVAPAKINSPSTPPPAVAPNAATTTPHPSPSTPAAAAPSPKPNSRGNYPSAPSNAAAETPQAAPPAPPAQPHTRAAAEAEDAAKYEAARLANARQHGAAIQNGKLVPHPDGKGLLHNTGFVSTTDSNSPEKPPAFIYRDDPDKGIAVPYRDDHGKHHQIPVNEITRVAGPNGKVEYHFMVGGKPISIPEDSKSPLFQVAPDGKRFTTTPDGTRLDLGNDIQTMAQNGVIPRTEAAEKALQEKTTQGAEITRQLTEKQAQATAAQQRLDAAHQAVAAADQATGPDSQTQRIRAREERIKAEEALQQRQQEVQAQQKLQDDHYSTATSGQIARRKDIARYKTAAAESPANAQWQKDAISAHEDTRAIQLSLIAEAEKKDPAAAAAAMRRALVPQHTQRLFAAAEKSFGGTQPAAGQTLLLKDMLMQAPELKMGTAPLKQADAALTTSQNALGITDPENVHVTRSANGSYSLSRLAADGTHQPFATLDPKTNSITLTAGPNGQFSQTALDLAKSAPAGTPVYLPSAQPPFSEAQVSDLIQKGQQATTSTSDRKTADTALTQAGLSPEGIQKLRNDGRLSVQDAKFLNDKFNSGVGSYAQREAYETLQKQSAGLQQMFQDSKAPADKPNFKSWMDKGDPQRDAQVQAKAKELGMSEDDVRRAMEDQRRTDFATPLTQQGHDQQAGIVNAGLRGIGFSGHDQDTTRTLTDGSLAVNPSLTDDKAKFEKAIQDSNASPEAKEAALKSWPAQHEAWLTRATDTLKANKTLPGVQDYTEWLTSNTLAGHFSQKLPDGSLRQYTDNEKTQIYLDAMQNRSGVRKFMDMVSTSLVSGGGQVVAGLLGAEALLRNGFQDLTGVNVGGQALSEAAAAMAAQNQGLIQSNELTGTTQGKIGSFLSGLI